MEKYESEDPFPEVGSFSSTGTKSSASGPTTSGESPKYSSSDDSSPTSMDPKHDNQGDLAGAPKKKANSYVYRIREHGVFAVKMGPKFSETVKGKLSLGAQIIRKGGRENIFRHMFSVEKGELLMKASQCYLSTTAGPIAGILFISTEKIAFCSERKLTLFSSNGGGVTQASYKVSIPLTKIKSANESVNAKNSAQKYIEIVTEDKCEFWFMGFVRYEKAFHNLQKVISSVSRLRDIHN